MDAVTITIQGGTMTAIIGFFAGFIVGGAFGMIVAAVLIASRGGDNDN